MGLLGALAIGALSGAGEGAAAAGAQEQKIAGAESLADLQSQLELQKDKAVEAYKLDLVHQEMARRAGIINAPLSVGTPADSSAPAAASATPQDNSATPPGADTAATNPQTTGAAQPTAPVATQPTAASAAPSGGAPVPGNLPPAAVSSRADDATRHGIQVRDNLQNAQLAALKAGDIDLANSIKGILDSSYHSIGYGGLYDETTGQVLGNPYTEMAKIAGHKTPEDRAKAQAEMEDVYGRSIDRTLGTRNDVYNQALSELNTMKKDPMRAVNDPDGSKYQAAEALARQTLDMDLAVRGTAMEWATVNGVKPGQAANIALDVARGSAKLFNKNGQVFVQSGNQFLPVPKPLLNQLNILPKPATP